jgi:type II secretory pathway predicted ATPase ExeA
VTAHRQSVSLLPAQRSALAKIACAVVRPGSVALLCGPHGTGKTTLLARLAGDERLRDRSVDRREFDAWDADLAAPSTEPPDIVLVDDAHLAPDGGLARLVGRCLRRPGTSVVLAGEGRLLSLVARDIRVEQVITLRASLRPCSAAESRELLDTVLPLEACARPEATDHDPVARTIHEIAAGIPADIVRLAELAGMVSAARPTPHIRVDDVEALHRRLSPRAA